MASLSNSLKADGRSRIRLSLAVVTALGSGWLLGLGSPASAQQQGADPARVASPDTEDLLIELEPQPEGAPNGEEASGTAAPPQPVPVPRTLDELIPESALEDTEAWALRGVGIPDPADSPPPDVIFALPDDFDDDAMFALDFADDPEVLMTLEDALDNFALTLPEPLETDEEAEAFAALDLPVLDEIIELAEFRINDTVAFGFPVDEALFPERDSFTNRFRALSTLTQLDQSDDTAPQVAARARADADLIDEILRTYGYYGGEVVRQLSGGRRLRENGESPSVVSEQPRVRFDIYPGPQYRLGKVDLGGIARLSEPDATDLRSAFAMQPGNPLLADRIVEQVDALQLALGESGYPFAELDAPELLIDHAREEGDLSLGVTPGGRYAFGAVFSSDERFLSSRHLSRIARFREGELYRQSLEADLRRAILATGLVSSVTISTRETAPPTEAEPGRVALDIGFDRAPLRTLTGAIGYGTEDGAKVEASWEHRNLFPHEGALRLRGIIGTREMLASAGFRRNNFGNRDQVLFADVFASDINTLAVESRTIGVRGAFEKLSNLLFQKEFSWQVGAEFLITDERNRRVRSAPGGPVPRRAYTIAGLFGSVTLDQSDDLLDPTKGYRATLFLAPEASRSQGSQDFYLRAQADAAVYRSINSSTVLAGRLRAATIQGAEVFDVAPSRRLYGGGGASVRGYGFQGVGPRDAVGQPIGGASLMEFSIEARVNTGLMDGAVQLVPFFDAGTVSRRSVPDLDVIRFAAGLGLRYKTTFGPIRVDVGVPLNRSEFDAPVVVFIGLGQAF
jgi:translocation and assembly module TamA